MAYINDFDILEECDMYNIIRYLENNNYIVTDIRSFDYDKALLLINEEKFKKFIIDYIKQHNHIHNDQDTLEIVKDIFNNNSYNYSDGA